MRENIEMKKENDITVNRKRKLENCVFIKTFLMFSIVLYHSMVFWNGSWFTANPVFSSKILSFLSQWLDSIHIYAFVLVSGYIYCAKYLTEGDIGFLPFIRKKVKRLLVPYIFTAIVWVIPISLIFFDFNITTIIKNYVLAISPSQLWFLIMLFNVFLIVYPLSNFFVNHDFLGSIIVLGFYIIGIGGGVYLQTFLACGMAYVMCYSFFLGSNFIKRTAKNWKKFHGLYGY